MDDETLAELGFPTKHNALIADATGNVLRRSRKGWNTTSGDTITNEKAAKRGLGRVIFEGENE